MANRELDKIEAMVKAIMNTVDNEIGCADCFSVLDQFIDLKAQGKNATEIMPLVQEHLERCRDYRCQPRPHPHLPPPEHRRWDDLADHHRDRTG